MNCTSTYYYSGHRIEKEEISGVCYKDGGEQRCTQESGGKP